MKVSYNDFEGFFNERERCNTTLNYTGTRITVAEHLKKMHAKSPNVLNKSVENGDQNSVLNEERDDANHNPWT